MEQDFQVWLGCAAYRLLERVWFTGVGPTFQLCCWYYPLENALNIYNNSYENWAALTPSQRIPPSGEHNFIWSSTLRLICVHNPLEPAHKQTGYQTSVLVNSLGKLSNFPKKSSHPIIHYRFLKSSTGRHLELNWSNPYRIHLINIIFNIIILVTV